MAHGGGGCSGQRWRSPANKRARWEARLTPRSTPAFVPAPAQANARQMDISETQFPHLTQGCEGCGGLKMTLRGKRDPVPAELHLGSRATGDPTASLGSRGSPLACVSPAAPTQLAEATLRALILPRWARQRGPLPNEAADRTKDLVSRRSRAGAAHGGGPTADMALGRPRCTEDPRSQRARAPEAEAGGCLRSWPAWTTD